MKNIFQHLSQKLEEVKKHLQETKEISVKKLESFRRSVASDFQKTIFLLEKKKNFLAEAFTKRKELKKYRQGIWNMIFSANFRSILSTPFIYMMIFPTIIFHIFLEMYQQTSFRLCKIPLVKWKDHFLFDHHHLSYLNGLEKINCLYCSYFGGLMQYAREIGGRTERYWCPIKHARRVWDEHAYYQDFFDYLDAEGYRKDRLKFRENGKINSSFKKPPA